MKKKFLLSADKVNLIIAICAILISLASFYATYLQASAAEKQVKAMTLPIMGFSHNNYDEQAKRSVIALGMSNSGMGAAIVHSTKLLYKGVAYAHPIEFLKACCASEFERYTSSSKLRDNNGNKIESVGYITSPINQFVLPAQSDHNFFKLYAHQDSHELWKRLDDERWRLEVEFCYCSMLDDCFTSNGHGLAKAVPACDT